ncbi:MAG: hypothetical protein SO253_00785 [Bacilli bacterium]|nr:hypothetical protein [Bacilli bacterium]
MVNLVTRRESKEARQRAHKLIEDVRKHEKIHGHYKFFCRIIGSCKRGCIVKDEKGKYDLDFQIVLTKNSKDGDNSPTKIKKDFLRAFTDCKTIGEKVEDSTTVITIRHSKSDIGFDASTEKFSYDFVIISIDQKKRIRRNAQNQYTWVELPSKNFYIYNRFNRLSFTQKDEVLKEYIIPKIMIEKAKPKNQREASVHIFYQEINNYYQRNNLK